MMQRTRQYIAQSVQAMRPSGIRKYFDIAAKMEDVITLGIGEPDFVTPRHIIDRGIASLDAGKTAYTSNSGLIELRRAIATYIERLYGVSYDPEDQIVVTIGVS
jgi:aminotransferase